MLTGKKLKLTPEEREVAIRRKNEVRDKFELQNCGDYTLIFPPKEKDLIQ